LHLTVEMSDRARFVKRLAGVLGPQTKGRERFDLGAGARLRISTTRFAVRSAMARGGGNAARAAAPALGQGAMGSGSQADPDVWWRAGVICTAEATVSMRGTATLSSAKTGVWLVKK